MNKQTFESALERLETIVADLEAGELPLDAAVKAFQEGMELTKFCKTQLADAESRLQKLIRDDAGQLQIQSLD